MGLTWSTDRRFNQALLASLALHLVAAMMLPALIVLSGPGPQIETISFVHTIRLQIATPRPHVHPLQALAPVLAPVAHILTTKALASTRPSAHKQPALKGETSSAPVIGAIAQNGVANAQPGADASPSAAPANDAATASTQQHQSGYMPFGAEQAEPVLDPHVLAALKAMKVTVTLIVTVDDSGRFKDVVFAPPLDAATQSQIRAMLSNASWDPATCGAGVPCEAQTKIIL